MFISGKNLWRIEKLRLEMVVTMRKWNLNRIIKLAKFYLMILAFKRFLSILLRITTVTSEGGDPSLFNSG